MASFPETGSSPDLLDTARGSVAKVEPTISQGRYPALGTIAHRDPQTSVGKSPGRVISIIKDRLFKPESPGSSEYPDRKQPVTTPSGTQPKPKGLQRQGDVLHTGPATSMSEILRKKRIEEGR